MHVSLAPGGGYQIEHVVTGDTVTDVLKYVSYAREDLVARVRRFAELAVRGEPHDPGRDPLHAAHVRRGPVGLHVPGTQRTLTTSPARG